MSRPAMQWLRAHSALMCFVAAGLCPPLNAVHAQPVVITGLAYDSLHTRPLAGALVTIEGTGRSALSDANGRFRFDSVAAGS
ncbi:MAG: carboxypeptidase-like regulatory domain-containing protein [Gemmatimonadaceae bacterium]|nr:carboxypeptidase-like regulatory domain-containing protein [Gemmatimonadaceae bacterium]